MNLGKQTVKRTVNTLEHSGVKAAVKSLPKVASYYAKSSNYFYTDLRASFKKDLIMSSMSSISTSDKVKQQYQSMLGW